MNESARVITHYRKQILQKLRREPIRPFRQNAEDVATANRFVEWCRTQMVDPVRFIDARVNQLWTTQKRIPGFKQLASDHLVRDVQRAEVSDNAAATQIATFDQTVRDLAHQPPAPEQLRRRYHFEQKQELCLANDANGGFEPRSHYCPTCPQAAACAAQTNAKWGFDVVSLRLGRVENMPEPVRRALRGWDGGLSV